MKVTFVVGPTASGKSDYALSLAEKNQGVIVNCDSVQAYDLVQIGAAKPSSEDLQRVKHHLYSYVKPPQESTAGEHRREVMALLEQLQEEGVPHVYLVGGTGFYFQAIEKGMFAVDPVAPEITDQLLEESQKPEGLRRLYQELQSGDPVAASKIHENDQYRILRSLEILRGTGRRPSELLAEKKSEVPGFPYPLQKIGIWWDRLQLHHRIAHRVKVMLASGLIDEVKDINKLDLQHWAPLKSVGYKEVQAYLRGELANLSELEEKILISTRQLAKRQITWFRRDPSIEWIKGGV